MVFSLKCLISLTKFSSSCVLQVQFYERLSPLVPLNVPLGSFSNVRNGDCIVTFSRQEIYKLKVSFLCVYAISMLLLLFPFDSLGK